LNLCHGALGEAVPKSLLRAFEGDGSETAIRWMREGGASKDSKSAAGRWIARRSAEETTQNTAVLLNRRFLGRLAKSAAVASNFRLL
jgi:hypothetical protein